MANEVGFAYVSILPSAAGFKEHLKAALDGPVEEAGTEEGRRFADAFNRAAKVDPDRILGDPGRDPVSGRFIRIRDSADDASRSTDSLLSRLSQFGNVTTGISSAASLLDRLRGNSAGAAQGMAQAQSSGGGLVRSLAPLAPALLGIGAVGAAVGVGLAGTFAAAGAGVGIFALAVKPVVTSMNTAADAQQKYNAVVAQYGPASAQAKTALAQMQIAMGQLSPAEQAAAGQLTAFKNSYQTWTQSFDPQILPVFANGLGIAKAAMADFTPVVQGAGRALTGVTAQIRQSFASPQVAAGFRAFGGQVQSAIGSLGPVLANIVPAALNLFQAMNPLMTIVEQFFKTVGPQLPQLAASLSGPFKTLASTFQQIGPSIGVIFGSVAHVIGGLLGAIQPLIPVVLQLVAAFARMLSGLDFDVLRQLATAVGGVLTAVSPLIPVIGQVANILIGALGGALITVAHALTPVISLLAQSLGPVLTPLARLLGAVAQVIGTTLAVAIRAFLPIFSALAPVAAQFAQALASALIPVLGQLAPLINDLTPLTFVFPAVLKALVSLLPAVTQLIPAFAQLVPPIANFVGLLASRVGQILERVIPVVLQLAVSLLGALMPVLTDLVPVIVNLADTLGNVLTGALGQLLPVLGDALLGILQALAPLLPPLAALLGTAITAAIHALAPVITTLVQALAQLLPQLVPIISRLAEGLVPVIKSLTPILPTLAQMIGTLLVAAIKILVPVLQLVIDVMNAIPIPILLPLLASLIDPVLGVVIVVQELGGVWKAIWGAITGVISGAVNFVKTHLSWILLALGPIGAAILLLKDNWSTIWGAIRGVIAGAWNDVIKPTFGFIQGLVHSALIDPINTLGTIWSYVWAGIQGIVQGAWNFISGIFTQIKNGASDVVSSVSSIAHTGGDLNPLNWGTGTDSHPGGPAFVADAGGPEIVTLPGGKTFVAPTKMLLDLPAGTKVTSTDKTRQILQGQLDALGHHLGSQVSASASLHVNGVATAPIAAPGPGTGGAGQPAKVIHNTVNAQTNANPYQISQELIWLSKTAD